MMIVQTRGDGYLLGAMTPSLRGGEANVATSRHCEQSEAISSSIKLPKKLQFITQTAFS
jgi:hypothetical protein